MTRDEILVKLCAAEGDALADAVKCLDSAYYALKEHQARYKAAGEDCLAAASACCLANAMQRHRSALIVPPREPKDKATGP